jgi:hypothetical protein
MDHAYVRYDCESTWAIDPIDVINAITAHVRTNERDQHVGGISDKGDIDGPTEGEAGEPLRQTTRKQGCRAGVRIDPRDSSRRAFGDIQCAIRAYSNANRTLQSAS